MLHHSSHGKNRVRVAKVRRGEDGTHHFVEFSVQIMLEGGTDLAFTHGENRMVIATDTCKNHVYVLAKTHPCNTPENFAIALSSRFIDEYAHVTSATISVVEKPWRRLNINNGKSHKHGFVLLSDGTRHCTARRLRSPGGSSTVALESRLEGYGQFVP